MTNDIATLSNDERLMMASLLALRAYSHAPSDAGKADVAALLGEVEARGLTAKCRAVLGRMVDAGLWHGMRLRPSPMYWRARALFSRSLVRGPMA